ncbi:exodeoxyribonuclease III [Gammaproteobacteria bacterium SCGC AG-212-F23]|nr:exodeoxyribonuclease III [Gammaproteobacteria bacterium SCGC AG-212-F23]
MKIATWNVNSLRVRLPHVLDWLAAEKPDIVGLQETKLPDADFPIDIFRAKGYHVEYSGQRTYNGVAILSRKAGKEKVTEFPGFADVQRRILALTIDHVRIINLYIPNGESVISEKFQYKLSWLQALIQFLKKELIQHKQLIVIGDFNIAPDDQDVYDPVACQGQVLFSEKERAVFQQLLNLGLEDCFRLHTQPVKSFSWWDYRMNAFKRNLGLRIDHILSSPELARHCTTCRIEKSLRALERPSDHAPVVAEFMT